MTAVLTPPDLVPDEITLIAAAVARREVRQSWSLSPSGEYAACVLTSSRTSALELHHRGRVRTVAVPELSPFTQLVVDDAGTVLLCRHRDDAHVVQRIGADGALTDLCHAEHGGFWLARVPDRLIAVHRVAGRSTVLAVERGSLRPLVELDHPVVDVVWLGADRLAVTVKPQRGTYTLDVDLHTGTSTTLFDVSPRSDEAVVDFLPRSGTVIVSTTATGTPRLGIGPLDGRITFPDALVGVDYLAGSADGRTLAVSRDNGTSHTVTVIDTSDWTARTARPVGHHGPHGIYPRGALHHGRLTAIVTTATGSRLMRVDTAADTSATRHDRASVRETIIAGVPCLVYGDPASASRVVMALHGGPASAWRIGDDPLIAGLTGVGTAVVALNVRGSTGYGREHQSATVGRWGGPDRDDVHAVAEALTAQRADRPVLLGCSYGAWLALVSAGARPELFSAVAALSPFVSGARLLAEGGPQATLVARLGGQDSPDATRACRSLTVPVLLVHGDQDEAIHPDHSRTLARRLREHRVPVDHREVAGAGHDLFAAHSREQVLATVLGFVTAEHPEGGE